MKQQKFFIPFFCLLVFFFEESTCLPFQDRKSESAAFTTHSFRGFLPLRKLSLKHKRAAQLGGMGEIFSNAVQDGISSTSAFTSPTMFVGGFSMMMQPMPNGTEFAGSLTQALPHYLNLIPGFSQLMGAGAGRNENITET